MSTPDEIEDAADANALGPKKVQQGNDILEQHSVPDQLELLKFKRSISAPTDRTFCGIGMVKTIPPGAG